MLEDCTIWAIWKMSCEDDDYPPGARHSLPINSARVELTQLSNSSVEPASHITARQLVSRRVGVTVDMSGSEGMMRKLGVAAALLGMSVTASVLLVTPSWAAPHGVQACTVYAHAPSQSSSNVSADGGRTGCNTGAVTVTVSLWRDVEGQPWDKKLDEASRRFINGNIRVGHPCDTHNEYHSFTRSSGGTETRSPDRFLC